MWTSAGSISVLDLLLFLAALAGPLACGYAVSDAARSYRNRPSQAQAAESAERAGAFTAWRKQR